MFYVLLFVGAVATVPSDVYEVEELRKEGVRVITAYIDNILNNKN